MKLILITLLLCLFNSGSLKAKVINRADEITSTITTTTTTTATTPTTPQLSPKPNTTVCYGECGCFDNNPPFNNAGNYLPIPPEELKTEFFLHTGLSINISDRIFYNDEDSILRSRYKQKYPLKIIIHGFQNTGSTPWVLDMAEAILRREKGNVNVMIVNWGIGAVFPMYFNASANTRLVGKQTCMVLKTIRKVFYDEYWSRQFSIHCIGHSLGAHTCGYASSFCDQSFDRITAMDPAGPNFESSPPEVRIDKSDAKFVDVIHSNGDNILTGNFGMSIAAGHVDFYPNGGKQQPSCPSILGVIGGLFTNASGAIDGVSCSHGRAIHYYIESIEPHCTFRGYPCPDQASFDKGQCMSCNDNCSEMGYFAAHSSRGTKYLITTLGVPYCAHPFLVSMKVSNSTPKTAGELIIIMKHPGNNNMTASLTKRSDDLPLGSVQSKVIASEVNLLQITSFYVQFFKKPKPWIGSDSNAATVKITKISITTEEHMHKFTSCPDNLVLGDGQIMEIKMEDGDCQSKS